MLAHREQWLPHIINARNHEDLREHLQAALRNLVKEKLTQLTQCFPSKQQQELLELFAHANVMLKQATDAPVANVTLSLFAQNQIFRFIFLFS